MSKHDYGGPRCFTKMYKEYLIRNKLQRIEGEWTHQYVEAEWRQVQAAGMRKLNWLFFDVFLSHLKGREGLSEKEAVDKLWDINSKDWMLLTLWVEDPEEE